MRISNIHIYSKKLPIVDGPYVMSTMILDAVDTTIIKIVADNGMIGWGEVAPLGPLYQPQHALGARAAVTEMAPNLIGESCLTPLLLRYKMDALLNGHLYAKSVIEMAVFDLLGKHHKVPVCDLLGGAVTDKVPGYFAISKGEPDELACKAEEKVKQGFKRLQIKCGGRDVAVDIEVIRKVWEKVGNRVQLIADANRAMTANQTLRLSIGCRDIPLTLEQPCNSLEEIAAIRSQIAHPIHIDENLESLSHVLRTIAMNISDGYCLKISRMGGLNTMATIRDICAERVIPHTCEDSWGGDITAAATIHIAATVKPELLEGVWTASNYIDEHYDPYNGIVITDGYYLLPKGVGLGINPDEQRIGDLIASF